MKISSMCFVLLVGAGWTQAQTIVPKLDEQSRKGDMARLAQKQALEKFDTADKNKDGKLSRDELDALPYVQGKFERIDKNKDGFLDWEEFVGHDRWKKESRQESK